MLLTLNRFILLVFLAVITGKAVAEVTYSVVGTGQTNCYNNTGEIDCPQPGQPFYGQDAQHRGIAPAYRNNGDGTISDLNTGLMWVKDRGSKVTWDESVSGASACRIGGYSDWRMPGVKDLYSLINFNGGFHPDSQSIPYIDTRYFGFQYGDSSTGERPIDCQDWSSDQCAATQDLPPRIFGVNFADGRIKAYPRDYGPPRGFRGGPEKPAPGRPPHQMGMGPGGPFGMRSGRPGGEPGVGPNGMGMRPKHKLYVRYVRGNPSYGKNDFHDNGDGAITDQATGLMWTKDDSGSGMTWEAALAWVQNKNSERYLGHNDWRLPNAKELQSIADYTIALRPALGTVREPAIDPIFHITRLSDGDYPFYWTSTTHLDGPIRRMAQNAVYIAFGRALGWLRRPGNPDLRLLDIHGAGAQRSDPKFGNPSDFPYGRGPQGDVIRIYNYVRLVRAG